MSPRHAPPGLRWALPAAALLAAPLALPALHGIYSAASVTLSDGGLTGGATLWPADRVQGLLLQGLGLAAMSALVATIIGAFCGIALLLPQRRRWHWALLALLAASFCFGTVVHLLAWRTVFPGATQGAAGWALAVLTLAMRYAPLSVALLATGLASFDRAELETALCAGGAPAVWQIARGRLLRLAGMSLAAVGALVFFEAEVPPLLGVHVYAEEFLSQIALEPSTAAAAAMGWPMMAVALVCAALLSRLPALRAASDGAVSLGWIGLWPHPPRRLQAALPPLALGVAALPLVLLAAGALQATGRWPAHAASALVSSLWVAGLSALIACLWGWALAVWALRAGRTTAKTLNGLLWVMMFWPSALTGIAIAGWSAPDWTGPAVPLILAHTVHAAPFAAWVLLAVQLTQAAGPRQQVEVLGASGWLAFRHVHWPAARPGLLVAFMLCAGLSLAELTATVLTVPPGMETVILRLYNLLHYGDQRGVMLLALMQGLTVALAVTSATVLLGSRRARN